jgi:adenylate cyclase class IV
VARNVEVKARIDSVEALLPIARALADGAPERIEQDDTFFRCAHGRLKLRDFGNGQGELIHYERADMEGPKVSDYVRAPTSDPAALREALARAHGVTGRVRKTRLLLMSGQTRIHLDRVQGLGDFIELEVVLRGDQSEAEGDAIAEALLARLGVEARHRLAGAYLDLLSASASTAGIDSARKS